MSKKVFPVLAVTGALGLGLAFAGEQLPARHNSPPEVEGDAAADTAGPYEVRDILGPVVDSVAHRAVDAYMASPSDFTVSNSDRFADAVDVMYQRSTPNVGQITRFIVTMHLDANGDPDPATALQVFSDRVEWETGNRELRHRTSVIMTPDEAQIREKSINDFDGYYHTSLSDTNSSDDSRHGPFHPGVIEVTVYDDDLLFEPHTTPSPGVDSARSAAFGTEAIARSLFPVASL